MFLVLDHVLADLKIRFLPVAARDYFSRDSHAFFAGRRFDFLGNQLAALDVLKLRNFLEVDLAAFELYGTIGLFIHIVREADKTILAMNRCFALRDNRLTIEIAAWEFRNTVYFSLQKAMLDSVTPQKLFKLLLRAGEIFVCDAKLDASSQFVLRLLYD
ncbi:hypothetical protein JOC55_001578 [Paenibacillus sacheonensis]|nr:hypothetical protein [Paenibacillus sacheonensis]